MLILLQKTEVFQWRKYLMAKEDIMAKIKVTQVRSAINRPKRQKDTLKALGFTKLNQTIEHEETPQIKGMINVVKHLVKVEL